MTLEVSMLDGLAVETRIRGFTTRTDQPEEAGGRNSAPSPFETFLASLATCAGYFALRFCRERDIDPGGIKIWMETEKGEGKKKLDKISIKIQLPPGFPEKYRRSILKAVDLCTVKQVILNPPEFETVAV